MHYSPFVTGAGLLAVGFLTSGATLLAKAARVVLDAAGIGFLVIGLVFLALNIYVAVHRRTKSVQAAALTAVVPAERGRG